MIALFIDIGLWDVIDILLVALLLFQTYLLIRKTVAINIFIGVFVLYLVWFLVRAFNLELLSGLLGQFIEVGVLALIIVFQPEIRKFLLLLGSKYNIRNYFFAKGFRFSNFLVAEMDVEHTDIMVESCLKMSKEKTGALIVLQKETELDDIVETGVEINAELTSSLLESIFFKNAPLHDGAAIIEGNKIRAARCILPITSQNIQSSLGLRHRAAIGVSEETDAEVIVISEETGKISYVEKGKIEENIKKERLEELLKKQE